MCSRPTGPRAFLGGDLEHPGIFESFLLSRGSVTKELIFLSVGDTRDHRRQYKDPALRTISTEFLLNLLANLRALDLDHHAILTTPALCAQLQRSHCEYSCAWTSLWHDHPGLAKWSLKPYDMFLMWQQQWRYVARALELGYRVLRTDTDVYFAESPYPILHGPLLSRAAMVVQQDFGGPLGERPSCIKRVHSGSQSCGLHRGTALLNIGLLYVRSTPEGGAFHVINETWSRFVTMLSSEPARPPHLNGQVDPNPLIDQQIMRDVLNDLAVPTEQPESKPRSRWLVVPGSAASVYPPGVSCALDSVPACDAVGAEREKASFLIQYAAPKPYRTGERRVEQVALAPDWFFGRGCLTHVRQPKTLIDRANPGISRQTSCVSPPLTKGKTMLAPGPSAGLLVATHFVYSMVSVLTGNGLSARATRKPCCD